MEKGNVDENKKNMWKKKMHKWMNERIGDKKDESPKNMWKKFEMDKQRETKGQRWMKNSKSCEKETKSWEKR